MSKSAPQRMDLSLLDASQKLAILCMQNYAFPRVLTRGLVDFHECLVEGRAFNWENFVVHLSLSSEIPPFVVVGFQNLVDAITAGRNQANAAISLAIYCMQSSWSTVEIRFAFAQWAFALAQTYPIQDKDRFALLTERIRAYSMTQFGR